MATGLMTNFFDNLRRLTDPGADSSTDGELLSAYVDQQDEQSLTLLVQRYSGMIWGLCQRMLGIGPDAEDAFQATFLVLVRKADSIRDRSKVANWLYGVAQQTAIRARSRRAKQSSREKHMPDVPEQESHDDPWNDLKPILDEELAQLPEKYRTVIVLCDLQEKSRSEVAQELSWPEGTVAGRLSRARAMLAKRLTRRGVSINAAILASVLTANRCKAAPEKTLQTTIQSIKSGATTASVSSLVQGVLRSMLYRKIKLSVLILLVTLTFAAGGLLVYSKSKPPVKKVQTSKPDKTKTGPRYVEMTVSKPKFGPHQEKGVPLANTWLVTVRYQNKGSKQVILCPYVDVNIFDSKNNPVQPSAYIGWGFVDWNQLAPEISNEFLVIPPGKSAEVKVALSGISFGSGMMGFTLKKPDTYRIELSHDFTREKFIKERLHSKFEDQLIPNFAGIKDPKYRWNQALEMKKTVKVSVTVAK